MDLANIELGYWVIMIVVGLIFGLVGFFIGRSMSKGHELENTVEDLKMANSHLQAELDKCRQSHQHDHFTPEETVHHFDAKSARAMLGKKVSQDDLKIVEGIGPKIEGLFHNYNIKTWKALSRTSVAKCHEVLDSGGEKYRVHDPASWPMQAKMCYENKWNQLHRWQEEHKHGKL
jgi:predicted flap endonuclease-1-like 5' DNA nuclease